MRLTRREFAILTSATATLFGGKRTLAGQQRAGDARLTVTFKETTNTSARTGTHPLGLGAGRGRDGVLHVPAKLAPGPAPLMLLLHGAGSTGRRQLDRMIDAINTAGVVVLAPDSLG